MRGNGGNNLISDNIGEVSSSLQEYHLKMAAASLYAGRDINFFFPAYCQSDKLLC